MSVAPETVQHVYKIVFAGKECQTSLVNYRKGGKAFINLVTIISVPGGLDNHPEETNEVVYRVDFQADLSKQPNATLQKSQDDSSVVSYNTGKSTTSSSL